MSRMNWESVYPSVPASVHMRLEKALEEKKKMNTGKVLRPAAAIALTLLLTLLLGGAAYAATQLGILDYLVGGENNATEALKSSVQHVLASAEADGMRVELNGAVFDGSRLALSFTEENLNPKSPAFITLDQVLLEGEWVPQNFGGGGHWMPFIRLDTEDAEHNPYSEGFLSGDLKKKYTGQIQGEAVFIVSRPTGPLVVVDPEMWVNYDEEIEDEEIRADYIRRLDMIRGSNVEIADIAHLNPEEWYLNGYTVVDADGNLLMEEHMENMPEEFGAIPLYHNAAKYPTQMENTAVIRLPFTIDADAAKAYRREGKMADVQLSDCTVHLEKCVLTPLSTLLEIRLYPLENTRQAADKLLERYGYPALLNENGKLIEFLPMEGEGGLYVHSDQEGKFFYALEYAWGGAADMPDVIRFSFDSDEFPYQKPEAPGLEANREFGEKVIIHLQ